MLAQGTGGCLLFNVSKQAVSPGANFGPYGLPKAATLFLVRQYALDHGADGIRANAVNADRVRSGLLTAELVAERAKARGEIRPDVDTDLAVDLMVGPFIYRVIITGGDPLTLGSPAEVLEAALAGLRPR